MLLGTIKYKGHPYRFKGKDISVSFGGDIQATTADGVLEMSYLEDTAECYSTRRFKVGLGAVQVEVEESARTQAKEKSVKSKKEVPFNTDMFCRLGAIIRYAKTNCTVVNARGRSAITGVKDYTPDPETRYVVYNNPNGEYIKVLLSLGEIKELDAKVGDFEIDIKDNPDLQEVMYDKKNLVKQGFKLDAEYLGFDPSYGKPTKRRLQVSNTSGFWETIEEIVESNPEKELSWLTGKDYSIVTDENLEEICEKIMNHKGYVYYDTETTGLNITFRSRLGADQGDQLVGVVLSIEDGVSYYFPTQMKSIPNLCGGDHWYFMERYMRPILEGKDLVVHNMSFDWKVSYIYDINANIVHDTFALYKLSIGAEKSHMSMSLKALTRVFLERDALSLSDLVQDGNWGGEETKFWDLPKDAVRLYACADTDNTKGLLDYAISNQLLAKYGAEKVYDIEIAFSYAVSYQEFYGHKVDTDAVEKLQKELHEGQAEYLEAMTKIVGDEFNPNSSKQLIDIMYGKLGIPEQVSKKTNKVTTDKATLKLLGSKKKPNGDPMYPFVDLMLKYRELEGIRKIIDKFPLIATEDGYLFSGVQQYGTTTGRVSIKDPNYQSYNDAVKKHIVPRPGYFMFDTDYSSVEYRVLGSMVGNKMIVDGFYDPDFDYHAYQAARMYEVPYAQVTKDIRSSAKSINFGLPYGMGHASLGATIWGEVTDENTRKAAELERKYFVGQEDIREFFESARGQGVNQGYTETYFGRRRYYDKTKFSVASIRRQAGNQVIQGTAADLYKMAVGRVFKRICSEGWLGKVMLTGFIHDELLGEVHESIDPMVFLKMLREEFEVKVNHSDGTPWCPLYMGYGYGRCWYEAKSVEIPIKLQWKFVEEWGEKGYPNWSGDLDELCNRMPDLIEEFNIGDTKDQILEPENQGKEIKPALNSALLGIMRTYKKTYSEVLEDRSKMSTYYYESIPLKETGEEYKILPDCGEDTQLAIDLFCQIQNVDRSKVNLENIGGEEGIKEVEKPQEEKAEQEEEKDMYSADLSDEEYTRLVREDAIRNLGMTVDVEEKKIYLKMIEASKVRYMLGMSNTSGEGYVVYLVHEDEEGKQTYHKTGNYYKSNQLNTLQQIAASFK